jgi:hypothetical protein
MVVGVDACVVAAEGFLYERPGLGLEPVCGLGARPVAIVVQTMRAIHEILLQSSAEKHVQHLHAPTDRKKRNVALESLLDERVFKAIPPLAYVVGPRMRFLSVVGRIDIAAATQDEPRYVLGKIHIVGIDVREYGAIIRSLFTRPERKGRVDLGPASRLPQCLHVGERESMCFSVPRPHPADGDLRRNAPGRSRRGIQNPQVLSLLVHSY